MKIVHYVLLFSAFFILSVNAVNAQKNCKYDIDKKDPFTGKQILMIQTPIVVNLLIGPYLNWQLRIEKKGEDYNIGTVIVLDGKINESLEKGDSIMFKFADGKIVTCYAKDPSIPKVIPVRYDFLTSYESVYPISVENFKTFTTTLVTYVQMNTGVKVYQKEMNEKNSKKIVASALCIMQ